MRTKYTEIEKRNGIAIIWMDEQDSKVNKIGPDMIGTFGPMMDAIVAPYKKVVESVKLNAPRIPIISTVTAEWLKDDEAVSSSYWSDHLRSTVRFAQAVKFAWSDASRVMLEVGPRTTATTLARQQSSGGKIIVQFGLQLGPHRTRRRH
jgi:acyl transferase domain-containing protein